MIKKFDIIKSRRTLWPDFRAAGLLLRGDGGGGTSGGGSRVEAVGR